MCGIVGIVGTGADQRRDELERMIAAIAHRGPDGAGSWAAPSGLCLFGHRRLSILDLTESAAQPMIHPGAGTALTYNGEIYNYQPFREELLRSGEALRSTGDTETLLALLTRDGHRALAALNGMYALGFWDEAHATLTLARDPFGQKPLYYARRGGLLLFASEMRALFASGLVEPRIDPAGVLSYLAYGAPHEPSTLAQGVRALEPGSWLEFDARSGRVEGGVIWTPPRDKDPISGQALREHFLQAVKRHLISDAPIGVFLSGGIDSSAVAAAAARVSSGRVVTLGVSFPDRPEFCENTHARRVADLYGTDHREIPFTVADALEAIPSILDSMDQPTIDGVNTAVVSRAARAAGLKVALSGLGGDELFGGYPTFRDVPRLLALRGSLGPARFPAAALVGALAGEDSRRAAKLVGALRAPGDPLSLCLLRRRLFSDEQIGRLAPGLAGLASESALTRESISALRELCADRPAPDQIGLVETRAYMGQMLLRDTDVMAMAAGLEVRAPFLDLDFASAALRLEPAARRPRATPKWRFTEAMGDWLPRENVERPKMGFTFPFASWLGGGLREQVESGLSALGALEGLLDARRIDILWKRFLQNPQAVGWSRPWSLFALGRVIQRRGLKL